MSPYVKKLVFIGILFLSACTKTQDGTPISDNDKLVKICSAGAMIFQASNGTYYLEHPKYYGHRVVSDPEKICARNSD